jgi:hypothetical protein
VIAFVVAVADRTRFDTIAGPAIERVREVDSVVLAVEGEEPVQHRLNAALGELAALPDLEAAVIVHEDVRLHDLATAAIVRAGFADPDVAVTGAIGYMDVHGLAAWEGVPVGATRTEHVPGGEIVGTVATGPVDALDGLVLCLSPWAVRTLRFDTSLAAEFHGYDVDLCFQARHHGRRVEVIELTTSHAHRPLFGDTERWARNELRFQGRWIEHRPITENRRRTLARAAEAASRPHA